MTAEQNTDSSETETEPHDFEGFISQYQEDEGEIKEFRRVMNLQGIAVFGTAISIFLIIFKAPRSQIIGLGDIPSFLLAPVDTIGGGVNFIESHAIPILESIPLFASVIGFIVFLGFTYLFSDRREELEVNNKKEFKYKISKAAVSFNEETPEDAVKELRSAINYRTPRNVLPRYKIEQTRTFLDKYDEIESEEEAREKVGIVLDELISGIEEESEDRITKINRELEERRKSKQSDRSHINTFIDVVNDKLASEPKRINLIMVIIVIAAFLLSFQELALLLATLFAGLRIGDYIG